MAGIKSKISIVDNASPVLQRINKNVGKAISGFMRLDAVSNQVFSGAATMAYSSQLDELNANVIEIKNSMESVADASDDMSNGLQESINRSSTLASTLRRAAGLLISAKAGGEMIGTSDDISLSKQRLGLILKEGDTVDELNQKILASANDARAAYTDTLDQVAKLAMNAGQSFESNDEIVKFVEQFNKLGTLGGASVYESSQAMYQLTQSMAKGVLNGDELRSVLEGMPLVSKAIADSIGVDIGTMKDLAAEGEITAEVVKNALLGASGETDAQFSKLGYTWGQLWTIFKNNAISSLDPLLSKINEIANDPSTATMLTGLQNVIYNIGNALAWLLGLVANVATFFAENWSIISPILFGVAAAVGFVTGAILIHNAVVGIKNALDFASAAITAVKTTATLAEAAAVKTATGATIGFNAALLASPITWIVIGVIAIVAALVALANWIAKTTGVAETGFGVIMGAVAFAAAGIGNIFIGLMNFVIGIGVELYNLIATFANFFANVFNDPVGAILTLFADMFDFILGIVESAAQLIDTVLGSDLSGAVAGFRDKVSTAVEDIVGEQKVVVEKLNQDDYMLESLDYGDAFNAGAAWGDGVAGKVGDFFTMDEPKSDPLDLGADYTNPTMNAIADDTDNISKAVDISSENLKYLRDIAEQEAINRFTTAEIKVEMNNNNTISSNDDIDGLMNVFVEKVAEAVEVVKEGV